MNPIKDNLREEDARKLAKDLQESGDLMITDEMVKDNKIEFIIKDKTYRVRLLSFQEKIELDNLRRKRFGQLIKDTDILLEKDLIRIYEERGMSISELDEKIKKIDAEITDKRLALGASIANNEGESILKTYHDQIMNLEVERQTIFIQKNNLLEFSLENQLLAYVGQVISYLSTDIKTENNWIRMWNTYDDFINCKDEDLINKVATLTMALQYNY